MVVRLLLQEIVEWLWMVMFVSIHHTRVLKSCVHLSVCCEVFVLSDQGKRVNMQSDVQFYVNFWTEKPPDESAGRRFTGLCRSTQPVLDCDFNHSIRWMTTILTSILFRKRTRSPSLHTVEESKNIKNFFPPNFKLNAIYKFASMCSPYISYQNWYE